MKKAIIIALALAFVAVATARAGFEYTWGTANSGECAWGDSSSCIVIGTTPSPPTSGDTGWGYSAWGEDAWGQ